MDFIVVALKKNKKVAYADIKAAADKRGVVIYPIMCWRAKLLLGMVKAAPYGSKSTGPRKRGPGRPKGAKDEAGPGVSEEDGTSWTWATSPLCELGRCAARSDRGHEGDGA